MPVRWWHLSTADCHLVRLSSTTSFFICLFRSFCVSSVGFSPRFRSRSPASYLADCLLEVLNAAGRNEEATGFTHCFPQGLLGSFDSSCIASFRQVFVAGLSIPCPIRFVVVDEGSPRPINRGQFGVGGYEDGQMIAGQ